MVSEHPVEASANVADHSYMEPDELSMEIGVSDCAILPGSFGDSDRSVTAFNELQKLQRKREPFTVVTRLKTYRNMLITSIASPEDYTTMNSLKAFIMMREIMVASTETVTVSQRPTATAAASSSSASAGAKSSSQPQKSGSTNSGSKQPSAAPANQSILKQAAGNLFGK